MALTLRGDGTGSAFLVNSSWWNDYYNLLTGNMTDQPVTIANSITLKTQNAQLYWNGTLAGATKTVLRYAPTDSGTKDLRWQYTTASHLQLLNNTDSKTLLDINPSGPVSFPQGISFAVYDGSLGTTKTIRIFIGATDPATYTTVNDGDIWIQA